LPRYTVTGPDQIEYPWINADSPLDALYRLHAEALGKAAVAIVDGQLVFANSADQEMCSGVWTVTEFRCTGAVTTTIEIRPLQRQAA
jgi:hypothetical protein